jgi:uncharacterized membrane protein
MNLVPEWAPNLHPLVVHFPIALLFAAALTDVLALGLRRRHPGLRHVAVGLYALGAGTALAAFLTGQAASDSVALPASAITAVNAHADWALWTVWVFGGYALVRLAGAFWRGSERLTVHLPLALAGLGALFLVQQTAERGAQLVYLHGVGVRAVAEQGTAPAAGAPSEAPSGAVVPGPEGAPDGAWTWVPAGTRLPAEVQFVEGDAAALATSALATSAAPAPGGLVLRTRQPVLLVAGAPLAGVQVEASLDLSGFTGTAMLVHHVRGPQDYDFLAVDRPASGPALLRQGRVAAGRTEIFDEAPAETAAPLVLRVVAAGTHFRGYVGDALVTHGHGSAAAVGRAGLRLDGTGPVGLHRLAAVPVQ